MSDPHRPDDVAVYNENALEELAWAIEASVGEFKLFLARCNYTNLRSRLVERLRELTSVDIRILELKASEITLFARIQAELESEQADVLMVFGLESVGNLDELLTASNQVREEFRKHFHFPLVLWVNDEVLRKLMRLAPDFESWATTTEFLITTDELIDFLAQTAEQFFEGNLTLTLEACREIQRACHELQHRESELDRELQVIVESLLGFTEYSHPVHQNLDQALEQYQKALELWQPDDNLAKKAKLLYSSTICYYLKAIQHSEIEHPEWQETRRYLRQCLEVFEEVKRPDLVANSIGDFGRILRKLRDWEVLQWLAEKSLQWHKAENQPIELAQDYGFLAQVALAQENWHRAKELAENALEVLATVSRVQSSHHLGIVEKQPNKSVISYALSQYQFILAQSQHHLQQPQAAIHNLESAKKTGSPEYETELYLDILCYLHQLYFEQKQYVKAFEIKLERQSIEQQYGLRAFVGAAWIQPQRQAKLLPTQGESQEEIAPEIAASGRQLDVERLIERIGRNDCKLIVIHGQSGVGKSSLVNGGLVPALKHKAIGTSDVLPVTMRVYTNWVEELGKVLVEALVQKRSSVLGAGVADNPEEQTITSQQNPPSSDSVAAILEQLKQTEQRNLRTVLIFDQFEEFFFVYPDAIERQRFFEFVGECLNILSVKVILSLREDYLHYLLECDRLDSMKIIGSDILTKNVRYPLGNFSPEDAQAVIERLTARTSFQLESALISQLVRDLAGNLGEVRPIELQVAGAQLQTDKITTLARYREFGTKEELVRRYLDEVVSDCGGENKQVAELVLYLLTDEKGTRPLKTRAEIERDLQALSSAELGAEASRLDLVLQIFVKSGLVLLLPENPEQRYQLVHDYLAAFIRQQQGQGLLEELAELRKQQEQNQAEIEQLRREKLETELAREQEQRKFAEEELARAEQAKQILAEANRKANQRIRRGTVVLSISTVGAVVIGGFTIKVYQKLAEAQEVTRLERDGGSALRQFEFQQIEALVSAMQAGQDLQALVQDNRPLENYPTVSPILALQTILDNIWERTQLKGHQYRVRSASFSPDGKQIVTASDDNTAKVWDTTGKLVADLKGHQSRVYRATFSPDGKQIITASEDNTAKVWDTTGKLVADLKGHESYVNSASFSPDGKQIVTASFDNIAKVWDTTGKLLANLKGHQSYVYSASFSPDGKQIVTASDDNIAKVWDTTGKLVADLKGHQSYVTSASFSPDGKQIVTTSYDNTAKVWDRTGKLIADLKGHRSPVISAIFSPDGKQIVTASYDNTAKVWDRTGKLIADLKGHQSYVTSASFSPDGKQILTASYDYTAKVWNTSGKLIADLKGHQSRVNSASFSPDGKQIVTALDDNTAKVWDISDPNLQGHHNRVRNASFSPDGKQIVTASDDNIAKVWDTTGKLVSDLKGHQNRVNSASFSPDGKQIVTASFDNIAKVWDTTGELVADLKGHQSYVYSASFSPDGKQIVTASDDNIAKVWDTTGELVADLKGHQSYVTSASFSPDSKQIVTASDDNTTKVWDTTGKLVADLKGHSSPVNSANFSPDGKQIVTASEDNTAKVWNTKGKLLADLKGHQSYVYRASFSPDGKQIVTASDDHTAKVWNTSGRLLADFKGHTNPVNSASFSPDGKQIVTASDDHTAKVWDTTGKLLADLKLTTLSFPLSSRLSVSPNRMITIVEGNSVSDYNTAEVWRAENLEQLLTRGCVWLQDYLMSHPEELKKLPECPQRWGKAD